MAVAVWSRRLQFRAGPQSTVFHACEAHKARLERGDSPDLFFAREADALTPEDPDDELECYFCREG